MKYSLLRCLLFFIIASGLFSCSSTKYVQDGDFLLDKIHIKSDNPEYKALELRPYVRQVPNFKMFAINKTQLQLYNLSGKDTARWINRFFKRIGEPPVIFDSTMVWKTTTEMEKFFVNKGYMDVVVTADIEKRGKKVDVSYNIETKQPYLIQGYEEDIQDSIIYNTLSQSKTDVFGELSPLRTPLLKKGILFDRDLLDKERDRLVHLLRNRGYYAFEKDYITYTADTIDIDHGVDLTLQLHPLPEILPMGTFVEMPHKKYFFDKTYIYLDYDPLKMTGHESYLTKDSVILDNFVVYYNGITPSIRPSVLINNCFLTSGSLYSQAKEESTYSSYATLQALTNANIRFDESYRNDTSFLTTRIFTMPAKKQSVIFSVEGTNTAGDLGVAASANFMHRNLFKGSETFNFKVHGAYEAISMASAGLNSPYLELGADASIRVPKFMFPFLTNNFKQKIRASTEFSLSYNYQTRPEFVRTLLSGGLHYLWEGRKASTTKHQFDLLDISYIYIPRMDTINFLDKLPSNAKYYSYNNQFIVGTGYTYSYSNFDPNIKSRNIHSLRISFESAGNLLYAMSKPLGFKKNKEGSYMLFSTDYAQFVKGDIDFSKTIFIDKNNSIAWRIGGGIGIPYGNSDVLPFEKRYYSGGANSVRGWSVRRLGPGSYNSDSTNMYLQSGDIKLDLNIEYRSRFFWKLEAAAFIDAGNIWTIKNYEKQEDGQFKFNSFYKEFAVAYGLGLRLDYDFFLVRADFGWKAYNPANRGRDRWTILHPNFTNNFAWHIAVGYPF